MEKSLAADEVDRTGTFKWDREVTKYFIDMYVERKDKFRDPKVRKKTLWSEMAREMKLGGYNVDEDALDRKLRNMKKTYKTIKDKSCTGRGRVTWEYFHIFDDIFSSDHSFNSDPLICPLTSNDICEISLSSSSSGSPSSPLPQCEYEPPTKRNKTDAAKSMSSLYYMRKKMLETEERKAAASEDLNQILRETNRLIKERNDLLRIFLETRSSAKE